MTRSLVTEGMCEKHRFLGKSEEEGRGKSVDGSGTEYLDMIETEFGAQEHGE